MTDLLSLEGVDAFYGKAQVLHGVSFRVAPGEVIALVGRNGAGKTTALRVMAGLLAPGAGRVRVDGHDVSRLPAHRISRLGINYVPDTRRIFPDLTVDENLRIATVAHRGARRSGAWTINRVLELFPRLAERRRTPGDSLSGGEQQMLAIARGLMTAPRLLLLDEPTEGLAPRVVDDLVAAMAVIRSEGLALVIVEQKLKVPMMLASRQYVMEDGRVAWAGTTEAMAADRAALDDLLGL